nr:VanZ family protein [Rhizobium grahamii]
MWNDLSGGSYPTLYAQVIAWALLVFIFFVTVSPIRMRPRTITRVNLDRALVFASMAFFFVLGYPRYTTPVVLACVVGSGLSELLQLASPSRHARLGDAMAKSIGAAAGAGVAIAALLTSSLMAT